MKNQHECAVCDTNKEQYIFREDVMSTQVNKVLSPSSSASSSDVTEKQSNLIFKQILDDGKLQVNGKIYLFKEFNQTRGMLRSN